MEEKKIEGGGEGGGGGEEGGRRETPELPFLVTNCHVCTFLPQQVWSFQSNLLSFPKTLLKGPNNLFWGPFKSWKGDFQNQFWTCQTSSQGDKFTFSFCPNKQTKL